MAVVTCLSDISLQHLLQHARQLLNQSFCAATCQIRKQVINFFIEYRWIEGNANTFSNI